MQEFWAQGWPGRQELYRAARRKAAAPTTREIVSFDGRVMVLRYVDPEVAGTLRPPVCTCACAPRAVNCRRPQELQ